ncbi:MULTISPECIES: VTT domain-containing protein [unclassified Halorhabdus]|uniref:YqaA family protein n=1 Tax=unclassified Halorhabdus TaxID=2621901 RepID=UPI0023DADCDE|nr:MULTISPECIES: VTT domain-containing protein [unclassified Halorhabdus]
MSSAGFFSGFYAVLEDMVRSATGPLGLAVIAIYSFLIAFVLPLPSEIVLAPAGHMQLGLSYNWTLAVIVLVSGLGKAAGSVFAFHIGQEAKEYGPLVKRIKESRFDVIEWSERKTVQLARKFGYVGLALALSVPFFPDTISIYAFTILEKDYGKFALATFAGSVGRLLVTMGIIGGGAFVL